MRFTIGASAVATLPWRSVRARSLALRETLPSRSSIASDRSIRRGKSMTHSCSLLRRVRADDVAELALVALVDDHLVLRVGEHADVRRASSFSSIIRNRSLKLGQNRTQMRQSEQIWNVRSRSARARGRVEVRRVERVVQMGRRHGHPFGSTEVAAPGGSPGPRPSEGPRAS